MLDETTPKDRMQRTPPPKGLSAILQSKEAENEGIRDALFEVENRFELLLTVDCAR